MKAFKENIEILRLKGKDVSDFLQRVSTNNFRNFVDNTIKRTVFTNDKGRIIDIAAVLKINSEYILVCSAGRERLMADFLNKYIITEDFEIEYDKCVKYSLVSEFNKKYDYLNECNFIEGNFIYLDDYCFRKIVLLSLNEDSDFAKVMLKHSEFMSDIEFKSFAIEKGYLYDSNELNEEINPLECGLKEFISFNKGCYIGQEVIARLDSQGKVPKVMLKINADFEMYIGDKIYRKDSGIAKECGFISSTGKSKEVFTALGFIREIDLNDNYNYYINKDIKNNISINKFK